LRHAAGIEIERVDALPEMLIAVALPAREHSGVELAPGLVVLLGIQLVGLADVEFAMGSGRLDKRSFTSGQHPFLSYTPLTSGEYWKIALGAAKRTAFGLTSPGIVFGGGRCRAGSAPRLLVSLVPFRDERLVRSRMIQIADAPACRVIRLRGVAQLMAQRNLAGPTRTCAAAACLNCLISVPAGGHRLPGSNFAYFLLYCLAFFSRRSA